MTIDMHDSHEPLQKDWSELAERSRNIFATWDWADTWLRHLSKDSKSIIATGRSSSGRLTALIPLSLSIRGGLRILRFIGHTVGDQLGPVHGPNDRAVALESLRLVAERVMPHCDIFLGENLPHIDDWNACLCGRVLRREPNPVLEAAGRGWEAFLASRSVNFRQQVRRRERQLKRKHDVRYRLTQDHATLEKDLDILFRLHSARWTDKDTPFSTSEGFHRAFAARALENGWLRLWFLELDGAPVACWYGFRFAGVESYYQAGRAPEWAHQSVGFVLLAHTVREALEDGVDEYRFLRGGEDYKYRFVTNDDTLGTVAMHGSLRGRAALAAVTSLRRIRPFQRALSSRMRSL